MAELDRQRRESALSPRSRGSDAEAVELVPAAASATPSTAAVAVEAAPNAVSPSSGADAAEVPLAVEEVQLSRRAAEALEHVRSLLSRKAAPWYIQM